jgi:hypothetical protein
MTGLRFVVGLVIVAVVVAVGLELASPALSKASARDTATSVAAAAAHQIFLDRTKPPDVISTDARAAANAKAKAEHVTLTAFNIDPPDQVVHVTISKQARSIIIKRTPWKHYDDLTVSATARPS